MFSAYGGRAGRSISTGEVDHSIGWTLGMGLKLALE